jgi:hypothetical protein
MNRRFALLASLLLVMALYFAFGPLPSVLDAQAASKKSEVPACCADKSAGDCAKHAEGGEFSCKKHGEKAWNCPKHATAKGENAEFSCPKHGAAKGDAEAGKPSCWKHGEKAEGWKPSCNKHASGDTGARKACCPKKAAKEAEAKTQE